MGKITFLVCCSHFILLSLISFTYSRQLSNNVNDFFNLGCFGGNQTYYNVSLSAYYPYYDQSEEEYYTDRQGKKLRTVQDFLEGRSMYITAGMDPKLKIPYGTAVCIPELNHLFDKRIHFQIRDDGIDTEDEGYSRIYICVDTEESALNPDFNLERVTLIF